MNLRTIQLIYSCIARAQREPFVLVVYCYRSQVCFSLKNYTLNKTTGMDNNHRLILTRNASKSNDLLTKKRKKDVHNIALFLPTFIDLHFSGFLSAR